MKRPLWVGPTLATMTSLGPLCLTIPPTRADDGIETIVFVRHGEKPDQGLGQLDCVGLNRAIALPQVVSRLFGKPTAIFAPDPSDRKIDDAESYDYVRPLATIEPTAIFFGLPVNASIGVSHSDQLQAILEQPQHRNDLILVAWEHNWIEKIVRSLLAAHGGDMTLVPKWHGADFDSIYIVTMTWAADAAKATFVHQHEGLDGQSAACPHPTPAPKEPPPSEP